MIRKRLIRIPSLKCSPFIIMLIVVVWVYDIISCVVHDPLPNCRIL